MQREVRKVHKDWQHPVDADGSYIPLHDNFKAENEHFLDKVKKDGLDAALDYMNKPYPDDYMPEFNNPTHLMMYECTSEGTPLSPALETPEELAQWCFDNKVSAFASMTSTYEEWLYIANGGVQILVMGIKK